MRSLLVLILVVLLACQGCATVSKKETVSEGVFSIRKVGVSPKTFDPEKGEKVVIQWNQNRKAKTAIEIRKENGEVVSHFEEIFPEGDHQVVWDGQDKTQNLVFSGVYLYAFRSVDEKGNLVVHDPSLATGGEELKIERFTFDKEKGELQFILPRAARARLRIGLSPFVHLRTLMDWEPMEAGSHTLIWDGLDSSGWIRAINHPDLSMNLAAYSLPDNAIIVKGNRKEETLPTSQKPSGYLHARHDRSNCRDITFQVEFPNIQKKEEEMPVLDEKTLVRVRLNEEDKNFMVNQRFEVMFFVDTVFLFEEEEGQDPFNFEWDTTGLAPGEHLLTVNLIGYDDHLGVKTVRVVKQRSINP